MAHFPHGAMIAIHAAEEERKKLEQEEEEMTAYTSTELENSWEFKIVRGSNNAFRDTHVLMALAEEEALAGWEMLEKLDDQRVRFKRNKQLRKRDATLPQGIDPYRTNYGSSPQAKRMVLAGVLVFILLVGVIVAFFAVSDSGFPGDAITPRIIMIMIFTAIIAIAAAKTRVE
jgi:hypothetical protein